MAYVLGYLFADGYVFKNPRGSCFICFCSTDKELIEKVRGVLKSNHHIGIRKRNTNPRARPLYVLQIGSKEVFQYLKKFGIVQNKSLIIKFPKNIPGVFLGDFVRGYFDGDGTIYFKKHFAKDRQKLRWVFSSRFTSGSEIFLHGLHQALKGHVRGGFIQRKTGGYELVFSHHDSVALYRIMYEKASIDLLLQRKYAIFQKAVNTLYA